MRVPGVVLPLLFAAHVAAAQCPTTHYDIYNGFEVRDFFTARGQAGLTNPYYPYDGFADVSWDAPAGTLGVSAFGVGVHGGGLASIRTTDLFELVDAPPGTTVSVTVNWRLDARAGPCDFYTCTTIGGALSDDAGHSGIEVPGSPYETIYQLPLELTVGQPRRVTYLLSASAHGTFFACGGQLSFAGLPAGMSVVSCRGFAAGLVTPVRSVSWGRLKQLYR